MNLTLESFPRQRKEKKICNHVNELRKKYMKDIIRRGMTGVGYEWSCRWRNGGGELWAESFFFFFFFKV